MLPFLPFLGCYFISGDELSERLGMGDGSGSSPHDSAGDSAETGTPDHTGETGVEVDSGDSSEPVETGDSTIPPDSGETGEEPGCWAMVFDDTTDYALVSQPKGVTSDDAWTVEMWSYYETTYGSMFQKWKFGAEDRQVRVNEEDYGVAAIVTESGNGDTLYSTTEIMRNEWTHYALQWDGAGGQSEFWVNGVMQSAQVPGGAPLDGEGDIVFGYLNRGDILTAFGGALADVRMSNVRRYSKTFAPTGNLAADANTLALWKFDEGSGATAADQGSRHQDATLYGAVWGKRPCR